MAQLTIDLPLGQELSIVPCKPRHHIFPFTAHGRLGMNSKLVGFDTGSVLKNLSTVATWMFWTLESKECRNRMTNVCKLTKDNLTKEEASRIQRAYTELQSVKLIVRIAPHTYLMNPAAMLPEFTECEAVWKEWVKVRTAKGLEV